MSTLLNSACERSLRKVSVFLSENDTHDVLVDVFRRVLRLDRNPNGFFEKILDYFFNVVRKRRREEKRVTVFRHTFHNETHIGDESHIEHPVRFVEYDRLEFRKLYHFSVDEIFETSRRADDEIVLIFKSLICLPIGAPPTQQTENIFIPLVKVIEFFVYLYRKFARRRNDEDLFFSIQNDFVYERNKESRRLARAGIGYADDIGTLEDVRDGAVLNRRRRAVSFFDNRVLESLINFKIGERVFGFEILDFLGNDGLAYEFCRVNPVASVRASATFVRRSVKTASTRKGFH